VSSPAAPGLTGVGEETVEVGPGGEVERELGESQGSGERSSLE